MRWLPRHIYTDCVDPVHTSVHAKEALGGSEALNNFRRTNFVKSKMWQK